MCAIFGFYRDPKLPSASSLHLGTVARLAVECSIRGRDGVGATLFLKGGTRSEFRFADVEKFSKAVNHLLTEESDKIVSIIGNCRAEPTTEWQPVKNPDRLQPYTFEGVHAVHNGTIANDKEFLTDWPAGTIDSQAIPVAAACGLFEHLIGSQATALYVERKVQISPTLGLRSDEMLLHRNYRPLAVIYVPDLGGWLFASKLEFMLAALPADTTYRLCDLPANTSMVLPGMEQVSHPAEGADAKGDHAIVILSGGLDSTTVAQGACLRHSRVTLVHFLYGCRAQSKETEAVKQIAQWLQTQHAPDVEIKLEFIDMSFLKQLGGSSLTDPDAEIAKGEAGAEFAHEWVPFRNGLMLSSIVAYCDRHRASHIYLGTNLEEAGAYGDNEQEFYELMGKAIAIGSKSAPKIVNQLENRMKHEIVSLALETNAPTHLSWSCYHGGAHHCGDCGPCYMRKRAFAMNQVTDPVTYEV